MKAIAAALAQFTSSCVTAGDLRKMEVGLLGMEAALGQVETALESETGDLHAKLKKARVEVTNARKAVGDVATKVEDGGLDGEDWIAISAGLVTLLTGGGYGVSRMAAGMVNKKRDSARAARGEPTGVPG